MVHPLTNFLELSTQLDKELDDLIDDAQVRMLSAHTVIGRNEKYIDLLYRLATQDVLATLQQYKSHKKSEESPNNTTDSSTTSPPLGLNTHSSPVEGTDNVAYRFVKRLSKGISHLGALPQHMLPQHHHQRTSTAVARRAWSVLAALREPRLNARLLVDLFEQAALERELALREEHVLREEARTRATHVMDDGAAKAKANASGSGSSSSGKRSATGKVLSRSGGRRGSRRGGCCSQPPPAGIVIGGGLPADLARLIGAFVPNTVQSMVMNV